MRIEDIKILPCFETHPPKREKLEQKQWEYLKTGLASADIVLDSQNYLIDGYCWYLIAKEYGLTDVPVRYGKRQIVRAYHKVGGKVYCWELPGILVDRVSIGEKIKVHTQRGIRMAVVVAVEDYAGLEEFKKVIRKTGKKVA